MPNWCMNELTVTGNADEIKRFVFSNMGLPAQYPPVYLQNGTCISEPQTETEPHFCFNALVPTPQEVLDIGFDGHDKISKLTMKYALLGQTIPPIDGYHWNIANWGTKWDIYYDNLTPEAIGWTENCESLCFGFDTAWSPPEKWFEKVAEMFPELSMTLHYEESGCWFAGDFIAEDGNVISREYSEEECSLLFYGDEDDIEAEIS